MSPCLSNNLFFIITIINSIKTKKAYLHSYYNLLEPNTMPLTISQTKQESRILYLCCCCCVQLLSCIWLFATPWTAAHEASLSFATSQSLCKLMSIESGMPSNHLILILVKFSPCLQSFLAPGSFLMSWLFTSGGQSVVASASVLPMNIQDRFHLGLTALISLQSKLLSRDFSNTTVQKHQFFGTQLSLLSNSHIQWFWGPRK